MGADKETVIVVSTMGCIGTFMAGLYYMLRAFTNKTGPKHDDAYMKDYSGRHEMDLLPAFVNIVTAFQYLGETIEESEDNFGFWNNYRYASYLITCPLMLYELVDTLGAPYKVTTPTLCFLSLLSAFFADVAKSKIEKWTWFTMGSIVYFALATLVYRTFNYANRLNNCLTATMDSKMLKTVSHVLHHPALVISTPMDDAKIYINGAFLLIVVIWPVFPLMFVCENTKIMTRNDVQVVYAVSDLLCKTIHSYCLDIYKSGLRKTVFSYGFLDTQILHEIEIWDDTNNVYSQLKAISRSMFGDKFIDKNGNVNKISNLDYQKMLVANSLNRTVDSMSDVESIPGSRQNSFRGTRQNSFRGTRQNSFRGTRQNSFRGFRQNSFGMTNSNDTNINIDDIEVASHQDQNKLLTHNFSTNTNKVYPKPNVTIRTPEVINSNHQYSQSNTNDYYEPMRTPMRTSRNIHNNLFDDSVSNPNDDMQPQPTNNSLSYDSFQRQIANQQYKNKSIHQINSNKRRNSNKTNTYHQDQNKVVYPDEQYSSSDSES